MSKHTDSEIRHALLDIIYFHNASCGEPECELRSPSVWEEIFTRLQIQLTDADHEMLKGKSIQV